MIKFSIASGNSLMRLVLMLYTVLAMPILAAPSNTEIDGQTVSVTATSETQATPPIALPTSRQLKGDWRYVAKPTDTVWSVARDYLAKGRTWLDLTRYNRIQDPKDLTPGSLLNIPISWLKIQPAPAVAVSVTGETLFKRSNANAWSPLQNHQYLHVGDTVRTMKGSVLIRFADGSVLRLEQNGTLIFNRLSQFGKSGMTDTGLRLEKGRVSTKVNPMKINGSRYEISTPSAVAAVRGTEFRVEVDDNGTQLEVTDGVVQLQSDSGSQPVRAGFSVRVDRSGNQRQPVSLPPAPQRLKTPPNVNQFPVTLAWQPVKNATGYVYQIFNEEGSEQTLVQHGTTSSPTLAIRHLANGDYLLHFMAISKDQVRGTPDIQRIHVQVTAKPAKPAMPEDSTTLMDSQPVFTWTTQDVNQATRLEIATNALLNPVLARTEWTYHNMQTLDILLTPNQYYWRLETRSGPTESAFSETRAFTLTKRLPLTQILSINYTNDMAKVFWKRLPNASGYVVELARESGFNQIEKSLKTTDTNVSVKLEKGVLYFLRIQAMPTKYYEPSISDPVQLELSN